MDDNHAEDDDNGYAPEIETAQAALLAKLMVMHKTLFPERSEADFKEVFLSPYMKIERSANELQSVMTAAENFKNNPDGKSVSGNWQELVKRLAALKTASGFFVKSLQARTDDRNEQAWKNLARAEFYLGYLTARISITTMSQQASKGAEARHAENRAMKEQVMQWLDAHRDEFPSMDETAAAIAKAGGVVPVKFRTARAWVAEWKKLRSAGTL